MPTITNNTAFTIAAQSTAVVETDVEVIAAGVAGEGLGRLIHPTLGTFDYPYMPEQWTNMDGSAIIFPNWQSSKTLGSAQNTLWNGVLRDTECTEIWTAPGGLAMPMDMLRILLNFFQNPPDPTTDYVQWWPSYITALGFDVVIKRMQVGSKEITFTDISLQGWIDQPVEITYQLIGSAA
jgi:hypothetical protein